MARQVLDDNKQKKLRQSNVIRNTEVVFKVGDIYVAECVLHGDRRVISVDDIITEGNNVKVLKG